ncbi:uncharacterized protein TNCV_3712561 [Trichonephila clavipes]|nr:uncharacterized protein TNCV_3712561 [Trichonephila clavipes]
MTPVDLPFVRILLNETFITDHWYTGAEKSFISEEVYRKYFSYPPRQKTKDRVVTAQGAPCCHLGRNELQIRIREFQKTWEFPILNNMQYQCILGIDFTKTEDTSELNEKSPPIFVRKQRICQLNETSPPILVRKQRICQLNETSPPILVRKQRICQLNLRQALNLGEKTKDMPTQRDKPSILVRKQRTCQLNETSPPNLVRKQRTCQLSETSPQILTCEDDHR